MTPKTSFVTVVAMALVAVPAAWGAQAPDAFERAVATQHQSTPVVSPDVIERAVTARLASQSLPQPNPRGMLASDPVENARHEAQPFNLRDVLASDSVESARQEAQPFNIRDVLASDSVETSRGESTYVDRRLVADNYREPPKPVIHPATIAASGSGNVAGCDVGFH